MATLDGLTCRARRSAGSFQPDSRASHVSHSQMRVPDPWRRHPPASPDRIRICATQRRHRAAEHRDGVVDPAAGLRIDSPGVGGRDLESGRTHLLRPGAVGDQRTRPPHRRRDRSRPTQGSHPLRLYLGAPRLRHVGSSNARLRGGSRRHHAGVHPRHRIQSRCCLGRAQAGLRIERSHRRQPFDHRVGGRRGQRRLDLCGLGGGLPLRHSPSTP